MIGGVRYLTLTAARTRAPLLALAATIFAVVGTFYGPRNEVGGTWALTSLLAVGLAAWLVLAVLTAEPQPQADIATAGLGGLGPRARVTAAFVVLVAIGLAIVFAAYPFLLDLVAAEPVFERPLQGGDVLATVAVHITSAAVGGAIGVLCSPPRIVRRASSAGAILALLLLLVVLAKPLGDLGGPVSASDALDRAPAGDITPTELTACASSILLFALLLLTSAGLDRRRA